MQSWMGKPYYSLDAFLHEQFQEKVYKAALDAGFPCPNRDRRGDKKAGQGAMATFITPSALASNRA